jgi:hypothetical protein
MKTNFTPTLQFLALAGWLSLFLMGCTDSGKNPQQTDLTTSALVSNFNVNLHPMNKIVCDPFTGQAPVTYQNGIKAQLAYRTSGMPRYYSSMDYLDKTYLSEKELFFVDLNVPTRMFTEGFSTPTGDVVRTDLGEKLIEYFGLRFKTILRITEAKDEGLYELASLADDGITVKAFLDGQWKTLISSEGNHPTKMGCQSLQSTPLELKVGIDIPLEVTYYQGPRYHISNVLMWRKVIGRTDTFKDSYCGQSGNTLFFDPNHQSAPLAAFNDLTQNHGWKVIDQKYFFLRSEDEYNPCYQGIAPIISNFRINEVFSTEVILSWETDLPSTSQVRLTDLSNGTEILTASDNQLRTIHTVKVSNLKSANEYSARAVSVSDSLGQTQSPAINFVTF